MYIVFNVDVEIHLLSYVYSQASIGKMNDTEKLLCAECESAQ